MKSSDNNSTKSAAKEATTPKSSTSSRLPVDPNWWEKNCQRIDQAILKALANPRPTR